MDSLTEARVHVDLLRATLALLLDHVDYTQACACFPTEMVAAVLPVAVIQASYLALERTR